MSDRPRVFLSAFADEAANHKTALEQLSVMAASSANALRITRGRSLMVLLVSFLVSFLIRQLASARRADRVDTTGPPPLSARV